MNRPARLFPTRPVWCVKSRSSLDGLSIVKHGSLDGPSVFGSSAGSSKRSRYRIDDPFMRLWFRVVAPHRAALAEAMHETRLYYWRRHRSSLEAQTWEELCRMTV